MSLDLVILKGAQNAVHSAAVLTAIGKHEEALKDVALAIELLNGALREDYESACEEGLLVVTESLLDHNRDTRPSDDGERRS